MKLLILFFFLIFLATQLFFKVIISLSVNKIKQFTYRFNNDFLNFIKTKIFILKTLIKNSEHKGPNILKQ